MTRESNNHPSHSSISSLVPLLDACAKAVAIGSIWHIRMLSRDASRVIGMKAVTLAVSGARLAKETGVFRCPYEHVNGFLGERHLFVAGQREKAGEVVAYVPEDGEEGIVGEAVEHPYPGKKKKLYYIPLPCTPTHIIYAYRLHI